jgi:hypothetical protein
VLPLPYRSALVAELPRPPHEDPIEVLNVHLAAPHVQPIVQRHRERRGQVRSVLAHIDAAPDRRRVVVGDFTATPLWPAYRHFRVRLDDAAEEAVRRLGRRPGCTWGPWSGSVRLGPAPPDRSRRRPWPRRDRDTGAADPRERPRRAARRSCARRRGAYAPLASHPRHLPPSGARGAPSTEFTTPLREEIIDTRASLRGEGSRRATSPGGGSAASPRATSTRRTAAASVTAPRMRRGPPQRSHTKTSIANSRCSHRAHDQGRGEGRGRSPRGGPE